MKTLRFKDLEEGMEICRDHFPRKPVKVYYLSLDYRRLLLRESRPDMTGGNCPMTENEFNAAGYVKAEA